MEGKNKCSNNNFMNFNDPLVSVIIAAYNAEDYIDNCIESILNQTYTNFEIVICDDLSTDHTRDVLKKYRNNPKIKILYNLKNFHQATTRNRCIEASNGKFIMVQDADDIADDKRIERLLTSYEDGISFVGSSCFLFDSHGKYKIQNCGKKYPKKKDLLWSTPLIHASTMFTIECLQKVHGYRVRKYTNRGEDYDLFLRLYAAGFKGKNIDEVLYGYRVDRNTYSRRTFRSRVDEMLIRLQGYKANHILFPVGWIFIFKPLFAYVFQNIRLMKGYK